VRAAIVSELGRPPEVGDAAEPEPAPGELVLEVAAAPVNPIDVATAAGKLPAGHPRLPYVPGCEAVGRVDGRLVWAQGGGIGTKRDGGMAERVAVPESACVPVPDGASPELAGAMGIAGMAGWAPFAWRAPVREGETVLVLGATGAVGTVAVQAARLHGAGRVVAAGRNQEALDRLPADATVRLDADDLVQAFRDACGGAGPTLIFDPLWGKPLEAALAAAAKGARIVQLGQAAGPIASLPSSGIRFGGLDLLGYSNFNLPHEVRAREYGRLVAAALAGDVHLEIDTLPLDAVATAWHLQAESPGRKLVLVP
jgi:NADPH2:quinone reductase